MRTQYFLVLLACSLVFLLGRWTKQQPTKYLINKFLSCRDCIDSCQLQKKSVIRSDSSVKTIFLDTITSIASNASDTMSKTTIIYSKPLIIHIDTIIDGEVKVFSDNLPTIKRRKFPSYKKVKNKIRTHFIIHTPSNDYVPQKRTLDTTIYYQRETAIDGIIIKDINTNTIESIRILIDSAEYVLDI